MRLLDLRQEQTGPLRFDATEPVTLIVERRRTGKELGYSHGIVILAYMIWPEDEQQRRAWFKAHQRFGSRVGEALKWGTTPELAGLFATTKALREPEHRKLYEQHATVQDRHWPRVASLFQTMIGISKDKATAHLAGKASLAKAADLLAHRDLKSGSKAPSAGGDSTYLNTWAAFRPAAHLIAAAYGLAISVNAELRTTGELDFGVDVYDVVFTAPDALLRVALGYEVFGTGWVPHAQEEPLLRDDLWRIPPLDGLTEADIPFERINDDDRAFLLESKRPRPEKSKKLP